MLIPVAIPIIKIVICSTYFPPNAHSVQSAFRVLSLFRHSLANSLSQHCCPHRGQVVSFQSLCFGSGIFFFMLMVSVPPLSPLYLGLIISFSTFFLLLRSILFDAVICRIRQIKISHFQPCYNGNNFFLLLL